MTGRERATDRALATLVAGALGDALGMPTQLLSPAEIRGSHGFVDRFIVPAADHPVAKGLAAGTVTDDTEQTLLLGGILAGSGEIFDHRRWVNALVAWERDVKARGSYDLLGPSTKRAIDAINEGAALETVGRFGDTNGAAMRIAPVGIMMPPEPLGALVEKVAETCLVTHNTAPAIAAASAVAAAISCGVAGGDWQTALVKAIEAARVGAIHGHPSGDADIAARIEAACEIVRGKPAQEAILLITEEIGTSVASRESVPAAFAVLEVARGDAWQAAVISANLGGDTDTVGAMAAGMAGACCGLAGLPEHRIGELKGFDIEEARWLANELVRLRFEWADGTEAA